MQHGPRSKPCPKDAVRGPHSGPKTRYAVLPVKKRPRSTVQLSALEYGIHSLENCRTVAESLKSHTEKRIDALYPKEEHGRQEGAVLPGLVEMLRAQESTTSHRDSAFDDKQSTTHDNARSHEDLFVHTRPSIVLDEGEAHDTFAPEVVADRAMSDILDLTAQMSTVFEDQFVSKYMPRVFPWALNYDCGGAEYPKLFANWEDLADNQDKLLAEGIQQRWRKIADEAVLVPGEYAKMLARDVPFRAVPFRSKK